MSKKKYDCYEEKDCCCEEKNTFLGGLGNCCCDFPTLIILILIILQFNKKGHYGPIGPVVTGSDECGHSAPIAPSFLGGMNLIDNSILFIIALFFLSCCNPCRK
jgi:hypothetical protein